MQATATCAQSSASRCIAYQVQPVNAVLCAGHRNRRTVKGVAFMGDDDEFVVSGSDCGHAFIWSKRDGRLRTMLAGDQDVVNCLEPHPRHRLFLVTSGMSLSPTV